ncbi:hypothetical protein CONCODRAFT_11412 [Conidiobolus coronatus NRRL 28638]|uniref:RNI-like protein n=1 Tax=Conidiobolus coronatus (strain ATCC 28846 / CBS 209.66 / NRRL 28638) TaxID=796925 RepID=A0A137NVI9_CONC2|nr:hypothetical protein CONCODRAFT_11412 [Conidiobolus coronatus NRRL 28638]|eukprot:KXN66679.1 hypothetical protein CONCODRAFT_11412 [Conidiobolus coronatus NRRL 28638]
MNQSINNKINWINVLVIHEFQRYLEISLRYEISLISKAVRELLKPLIFNNVTICGSYGKYSEYNLISKNEHINTDKFFEIISKSSKKAEAELNISDFIIALNFKLTTEIITPEDYVIPPNLNYLELMIGGVCSIDSIDDVYSFIRCASNAQYTITNYILPKLSVPSLKNLIFYSRNDSEDGLKDFLEVNPSLESLTIRSSSLNSISTLSSLKNLKLDGKIRFDNCNKISTLKSIQFLHIIDKLDENFEDIKKLCLNCSSLRGIHIEAVHIPHSSQKLVNSKLEAIVSNLPHLKKLNLNIILSDSRYLNLTKLSNIEVLILNTTDSLIFNLDFINCKKLNKVVFYSGNYKINTKEFREKFNSYKNWVFKFSNLTIRGFKINK